MRSLETKFPYFPQCGRITFKIGCRSFIHYIICLFFFFQELERWFKFWMAFYGKIYSPFRLVHGDFLEQQFRSDILQSSIVFVNNFAFGPEVDQHLKDIFADLNDGARIFSSKSFCALNFRITDRNLSGKWNFL